jgi:nucleotidyltransferase/DNA polymerase involved in DNA repair
MKLKIQVVVEDEEYSTTPIIIEEVACFERKEELSLETLGLRLEEAKQILAAVQKKLVETQVKNYLTNHQQCSHCHKALKGKDRQPLTFRTLFGKLKLDSPRFYSCKCQPPAKKALVL